MVHHTHTLQWSLLISFSRGPVHRWPLKTESFGLRSDVKLWSPMVIETGATACIGGTSKDINDRNVSNIGDEWSG
jgi:hypothetical protein